MPNSARVSHRSEDYPIKDGMELTPKSIHNQSAFMDMYQSRKKYNRYGSEVSVKSHRSNNSKSIDGKNQRPHISSEKKLVPENVDKIKRVGRS